MTALSSIASAQSRDIWSVDGLVQLGKRAGPLPVKGQWIVVHRIASDSTGAVSGGPLDSARSDAAGRYRIRFPHFGGQATYIAITTFQGVSYISNPLSKPRTSGDDAAIMVFDTTSPPYPIHVAGRHLIVTAPDSSDRRRIIEVYELMNDSVHTVIGTEANPVWRAPIPEGATEVQINPVGDISPAMTRIGKDWLTVFSPISPGIRQISFSYALDPSRFPLVMPVVDSSSVFELLLQEQAAAVEGGGFTEVAGVLQEGIGFRRFLAQNVPSHAVLRISAPKPVAKLGSRLVSVIAAVVSVVLLAALAFVFWWRRRPRIVSASRPASDVDLLVRELATMDAEFERRGQIAEAERAEFDARRDALKARLNVALAELNGRA
jgi:hypothetical protein